MLASMHCVLKLIFRVLLICYVQLWIPITWCLRNAVFWWFHKEGLFLEDAEERQELYFHLFDILMLAHFWKVPTIFLHKFHVPIQQTKNAITHQNSDLLFRIIAEENFQLLLDLFKDMKIFNHENSKILPIHLFEKFIFPFLTRLQPLLLIILYDMPIWNKDDTFQSHIDKYTFYSSSQDSSSSSPWAKEQNFWVIGCNHKKVGIESKNEQHCSIVQMITAQFWSHRSEAA